MALEAEHFDEQTLGLLRSGRPILTGVSGGRDSMALLHLLAGLDDCHVVVCHVNHSLRAEADEETLFVRRHADALGLPCVWAKLDVGCIAEQRGLAIEEAARQVRQELFAQWEAQYPGACVALAHHRGDQQETALLHLCRGAAGLRGMPPVAVWPNGLTVLRPLLSFSRAEITSYLTERGIPWKEDLSNQNTDYTRNALRHRVVPLLDDLFHRDTSLSFSRACRLEALTRKALQQALETLDLVDPQGRLFLPKVSGLPKELKQCAVHDYLRRQGVPNLTEEAVLGVMGILDPAAPSRVSLPGGLLAVRKEKRLFVRKCPPLQ